MNYKLIVHDEARHELRHETRYSARQWGPAHARRYSAELKARIRALATDAKLYALYDDALPDIRVMTYRGNRVVYVIDDPAGRVIVLAVIGIHQSVEAALSRLP